MKLQNKRWQRILNILMENPGKTTGESLAFSLEVSSRTIRNDIKNINESIKDFGAEIHSEIGQGYELKIYDSAEFQKILEDDDIKAKGEFQNIVPSEPEDRVRYIIVKLLLASLNESRGKIEFFDLEEELFISTSTLKKDLRLIEEILKDYDLHISDTKKEGIRIIGEEAKIRYCISEYIFNQKERFQIEDNQFYQDVFSSEETKGLRKILIEEITKYDFKLTDIAFQNLLVHSLIMLKRYARKKSVTYGQSEIESFEKQKEFKCAEAIVTRMKEVFHVDIGEEVYYLTQHLVSSQRFLIDDPKEDYQYKADIDEILRVIQEETNIDLSDDKQLINGLAMHLEAALQRLRFDMNIRNEFLDSIKNSYPLAFELAVLASEVIEEKYHLRTKENEIGFLAMHFGAALERKGLNRKESRKKILIVCIAGVATSMLLRERLLNAFGQKIESITTCSSQELTEVLIDQFDYVLTTVDLPEFHSRKIRKIHLVISDNEIEDLRRIMNDPTEEQLISYKDIFRKELFYKNMDLQTKDDVLQYMTNALMETGFISESVKKSIFKREEMSTTELGSLVAIPHALLNDMDEAVVSIMILKKPIRWEKEKVQVVLMLNIPKSKYDIWETVFKNLYQYLIGNQGVSRLIKDQNYEKFIDSLEQERGGK